MNKSCATCNQWKEYISQVIVFQKGGDFPNCTIDPGACACKEDFYTKFVRKVVKK